MTLTSYENALKAIEFRDPERLPLCFDSLGLNDFATVKWNQIGVGDKRIHKTLDEWGCEWERSAVDNMGQVKGHPLLEWSAWEHYPWPDPDDPRFWTGIETQLDGKDGKFILTGIFMLLFERMHALHGFENTLADLYLEQERIEALANRIVDFDLGIIENTARRFPGLIHGFSFTDDWGTQQASFVSPRTWREFFKPRYKRIFDACHSAGWKVWMHSCGKINDLLDDLIEIGLDIIEPQQPRALGIVEIGERFRGRLCFASLCDIQHTLPFKSDGEICSEARLLLEKWAAPQGGFILIDYGDGAAIGVSLEKKRVMLDAFLEADPWRARIR